MMHCLRNVLAFDIWHWCLCGTIDTWVGLWQLYWPSSFAYLFLGVIVVQSQHRLACIKTWKSKLVLGWESPGRLLHTGTKPREGHWHCKLSRNPNAGCVRSVLTAIAAVRVAGHLSRTFSSIPFVNAWEGFLWIVDIRLLDWVSSVFPPNAASCLGSTLLKPPFQPATTGIQSQISRTLMKNIYVCVPSCASWIRQCMVDHDCQIFIYPLSSDRK